MMTQVCFRCVSPRLWG